MLNNAFKTYTNYKTPGNFGAFGISPESVLPSGATRFSGYGMTFDFTPGRLAPDFAFTEAAKRTTGAKVLTWEGLKARAPGNPLGIAASFLTGYQGYQENGIAGAWNALALNAAVEASVYKWGYGVGNALQMPRNKWLKSNTKVAGHPLNISTSSSIFRTLGAGVGGYVGQQLGLATGIPFAGAIGATAGAYIGGAPIRTLLAHPVLGTALITGVGAAATSYGAYSVIRGIAEEGYSRRQMMRGVNTDGDISAFMTQNAHTMRARAVQAISKSHMNARSALGQEAQFMHSPKNYNSIYRM